MAKLLILADDVTGALDSGVQFTARGAVTKVFTDRDYDFVRAGAAADVLVMDAETRHLPAEEAYDVIYRAVKAAREAGIPYIYKKTDSALRGNAGIELRAAMDGCGADTLHFVPCFPRLDRVVKNGVLTISGVPVAESVFGKDPFEPVRHSSVADILREETPDTPMYSHPVGSAHGGETGIHIYDGETEADLVSAADAIGADGLRLCAGCAGFAAVLADRLGINGEPPALPKLEPRLFVTCGSVNAVTVRQIREAEKAGYPRMAIAPEVKLSAEGTDGPETVRSRLEIIGSHACSVLDANDDEGTDDTYRWASEHGLTVEDIRVRISSYLGRAVKSLMDGGLDAAILCTGGDTLLAVMRAVGVGELTPVCDMDTGSVLTCFRYNGREYHIISKSGGFGSPDLFVRLAARLSGQY